MATTGEPFAISFGRRPPSEPMNWLFEQPLVIVALGVAAILALGAAWSSSGRKELLYAARRRFRPLDRRPDRRAARRYRQRSHPRHAPADRPRREKQQPPGRRPAHSFRRPQPEAKGRSRAAQLSIHRVPRHQGSHLIDVDPSAEPRSAMVEFNVIASGTFKHEGFEVTDTVPRWVKLHLLRESDGRWTVAEYEHDNPQRMIMNSPEGRMSQVSRWAKG